MSAESSNKVRRWRPFRACGVHDEGHHGIHDPAGCRSYRLSRRHRLFICVLGRCKMTQVLENHTRISQDLHESDRRIASGIL